MILEGYLQKLEDAKSRVARGSMEQTGDRGAFDYGRASGMYAGLEMAKELLIDMLAEKERRDFDL